MATKKKKKTGPGTNDWAVAGYDWVYKPYGDSVNDPNICGWTQEVHTDEEVLAMPRRGVSGAA